MPIQIEIPDGFFAEDEQEKLKLLFGVKTDDSFAKALNRVALAALDEYRDMFLGMGMPSRANEIREFRLYYLIKRFFQGRIPDELEVSSLFQLPESRSKSLILYVLTRFRYDLEGEIYDTLRTSIAEADVIDKGREYRAFIPSANMVEELNRIISRSNPRFRRLSKVRSEPHLYSIAPDSYNALCKHLGIK